MKKKEYPKTLDEVILYFSCVVGVLFLITVISFLCGCTKAPVEPKVEPAPKPIALSWDSSARAGWSNHLLAKIIEKKAVLDTAKDIKEFCPKYSSLNHAGQLKAWGEFFVALAYYESGFNPKTSSVDVGDPKKRDTYSIGLFQVSVVDQSWAGGNLKYSYDQLLTPKPNMDLAMELVNRFVKARKAIFLENTDKPYRYFAVILRGNKDSKIPEIIARVRKYAPECG